MGMIQLADRDSLDTRSELVKAQSRAKGKVNACPFGCTLPQLDDNGYCRHLIGFTSDLKTYEPLVRETKINAATGEKFFTGRRIVRPATKEVEEVIEHDEETGKPIMGKVRVPVLSPILAGDKLVRITMCYRVYRDKNPASARRRMEFTEMTQEERDKAIKDQFHIGAQEATLPPAPNPDYVEIPA